jgi:hypothetical protein
MAKRKVHAGIYNKFEPFLRLKTDAFAWHPLFYGTSCLHSDRDPFHLVERDFIARAVIELGRAGAFVRGHCLRLF